MIGQVPKPPGRCVHLGSTYDAMPGQRDPVLAHEQPGVAQRFRELQLRRSFRIGPLIRIKLRQRPHHRIEDFNYNQDADIYVCPVGKLLSPIPLL